MAIGRRTGRRARRRRREGVDILIMMCCLSKRRIRLVDESGWREADGRLLLGEARKGRSSGASDWCGRRSPLAIEELMHEE